METAQYHFTGARRPYLYPIIGPTGAGMTRNYPMKEDVAGEEKDHPHHKGLWFRPSQREWRGLLGRLGQGRNEAGQDDS